MRTGKRIRERIRIEGQELFPFDSYAKKNWWRISGFHGGDEYGNCTFYIRTILGGIVIWYGLHYQTDVELPEMGEVAWVDRVFYLDNE